MGLEISRLKINKLKIGRFRKCLLLFFCTAILFCGTVFVPKAAETLSFEQITVNMPQVNAQIKGGGYSEDDISALLGSEALELEDIHVYDKSKDSTCAYILVDLSGSMKRSFDMVRNNIIKYVDNMGENDSVVLITFGETQVNTVLNGGESKEDIKNTVASLVCNENGTMFYEALSKAYQLSNSSVNSFDREYVLVFSDGIDEQRGNSTYDEMAQLYKTHSLPIYAACSSNASQEASDRFGELARMSGGIFKLMSAEEDFDVLLNEINDISILKLLASSNNADGQEKQLSIKIGDLQAEQNIPVSRSIEDNEAPTVSDIYFDEENKAIIISFSEKVKGALETSSYNVTDEDKNSVEVANVAESSSENTVEIKLKEIHNGEYKFTFKNITDNSKEANALSETKTVKVSGVEENGGKANKSAFPVWIIAAGVAVIVVLVIIVSVVISKKKNKNNSSDDERVLEALQAQQQTNQAQQQILQAQQQTNQAQQQILQAQQQIIQGQQKIANTDVMNYQNGGSQVKHHIKTSPAKHIKLFIKTGKNAEQQINVDIVSSIIIGRSDICDVFIDDTKLSRQHFALENDNGNLYIMDLNSSNGTVLNGIKINSRQLLHNNDKIMAGLSDIIVMF